MPDSLSINLIKRILKPIRNSSNETYNHHYKEFANFIIRRNGRNNLFKLSEVLEYFNFLVSKGFQVSTLKSIRSILREPLKLYFPGFDIGQDVVITKLLQFVKSNRPKEAFRFPAWDLDLVIRMIQLREREELEYVFKKTLFILFIACPYRVSEFRAISISSSSFSPHHVLLRTHLLFYSKNQTNSYCPQPIALQVFEEDQRICPVGLINTYLRITEALCRDSKKDRPDQLWIGTNLRPLTVSKISRWVKEMIFLADPNAGRFNFGVHTVRSQVASHLLARNIPVKEIIASMNWRSSSTFTRFYARLGIGTAVRAVLAGHLPAEEVN